MLETSDTEKQRQANHIEDADVSEGKRDPFAVKA